MILGPDDQCICLPDTYHESWDVCVPCPPYSSTLGLIGAQSIHECGKKVLTLFYMDFDVFSILSLWYRLGMVNSNTVNSKFHLI